MCTIDGWWNKADLERGLKISEAIRAKNNLYIFFLNEWMDKRIKMSKIISTDSSL